MSKIRARASVKMSDKHKYLSHNFLVEFIHPRLGSISCGFTRATLGGITANYEEYREGGNNGTPEQILDTLTVEPVTLTKGATENESIHQLANIFFEEAEGLVSRMDNRFDMSIHVKDKMNKQVVRKYVYHDCYIDSINFGELDAQNSAILLETITLRYSSMSSV